MQHPILGEVAAGFEEILAAFTSPDAVDLTEIFRQASSCVEIPVRFLERSFQVLHEVGTAGSRVRSGRNTTRSGVSVRNCSFSSHDRCCFVLLRFHRFGWGEWLPLLAESRVRGSRRIRSDQNIWARCLPPGKLWKGPQWLQESRHVTDSDQSSPTSRDRVIHCHRAWDHRATGAFPLDSERFLRNVRVPKKEAAGGLSGMTVEHLRPLLERSADSESSLGQELAEASNLASVVNVLRRGRITALQKLDGGVRGFVVGEVFR